MLGCNIGESCGSVFDTCNGGCFDSIGLGDCNPCALCSPCVDVGGEVCNVVGGAFEPLLDCLGGSCCMVVSEADGMADGCLGSCGLCCSDSNICCGDLGGLFGGVDDICACGCFEDIVGGLGDVCAICDPSAIADGCGDIGNCLEEILNMFS